MVRLIVLFTHPDDAASFEQQLDRQVVPLASGLPGLARLEVTGVFGAPYGQAPYHRILELYFTDRAALSTALASDAYHAVLRTLPFVAGLATVVFAEGGSEHRD